MHEIKTKKICCTTHKSTSQSEILWGKNVFQYIILTKRNMLNLQQNFRPGTPQHLIFSKLEMPKEHAPSQTSKQKACFS